MLAHVGSCGATELGHRALRGRDCRPPPAGAFELYDVSLVRALALLKAVVPLHARRCAVPEVYRSDDKHRRGDLRQDVGARLLGPSCEWLVLTSSNGSRCAAR